MGPVAGGRLCRRHRRRRGRRTARGARQRLGVATRQADLRDLAAVERLAADADVTVGTLPSTLALAVIERMARLGRRHVDVSFLADDLPGLRRARPLVWRTIVYDCGVAPGLSHLLVGGRRRQLAHTTMARIDVGGLPIDPRPPFFYKAPFAPADVIEEYTRPGAPRPRGAGHHAALPSEPATYDVPGVGLLEAFNTDGLRSLVDTVARRRDGRTHAPLPGRSSRRCACSAMPASSTRRLCPVRGQTVVPREVASAVLSRMAVRIRRARPDGADGGRRRSHLHGAARGVGLALIRSDRPGARQPLSSIGPHTGCPARDHGAAGSTRAA